MVTNEKLCKISALQLPLGWEWKRLGDICEEDKVIIDGRLSNLPFLGLEMVEAETGKIDWNAQTVEGTSTCFYFNERHILYGKLRPYLNKVALPDIQGRCSTELIPFFPIDENCREFIAYLLRRKETVDYVMAEKTGSRMPRANTGYLLNLKVPVPSPDEQYRIVTIIDARLEAVDKARKAAVEQVRVAEDYLKALLKTYFNANCNCEYLNNFLVDISYGYTASADFEELTPKLLRITDIQDGKVDWNNVPGCSPKQDISQYYLQDGDIVVARTGGTIGKTFLISSPPQNAIYASYLIKLTFNFKKLLPEYIQLFFSSDFYWMQLRQMSQGTGQPNVNTVSLKKLKIPILPLAKQKNLVNHLSGEINKLNGLKAALNEQMLFIDALPASILRKAFRGEL
jgi:type I restriction enzyme S subunit